MRRITKKQADIIGEVANICTGNAATTLSMMVNRATNITTPKVEVLKTVDELLDKDLILIKVPYTKGLDGINLMLLEERDALVIANLMMGGDGSDVSQMSLDPMTLSAISEAMNQMCGTIATSMAAILAKPTDIGYPMINTKQQKNFEIPEEMFGKKKIVKVTFGLTVGDLINSQLVQLYPLSIVQQILKQEER
jgi:flagellar motor switch protein FliN/FliY